MGAWGLARSSSRWGSDRSTRTTEAAAWATVLLGNETSGAETSPGVAASASAVTVTSAGTGDELSTRGLARSRVSGRSSSRGCGSSRSRGSGTTEARCWATVGVSD